MKSLYKCEKCGKVSEDYEEIVKCEQMHYEFHNSWLSDDTHYTLDSMAEYKEGQEEPNVIHVWFERSYVENGEWKEERRCGKYKLISSYAMPLEIKND